MNIAGLLQKQARERPRETAIIDRARGQDRLLTFGDLEDQSARAAALLRESGLRRGDTALVFQPMSAELYVVLAAVVRLGLVAMFLDPALGGAHIDQCCALRPPDALIGSARSHLLRLFSRALRRVPRRFSIGLPVPGARRWDALWGLPPLTSIEPCSPESPALLTFTSGSTGRPKAVLRTHGFLAAQHRVIEQTLGLTPGEVELTTQPFFGLASLVTGITSVIADGDLRRPGAVDPRPILRQIDRFRPTRCTASPAFLQRLIDGCAQENRRIESLRQIHTGGGPVFPGILSELERVAPGTQIVVGYGSTEAEPIARVAPQEFEPGDVQAMSQGRGLLAGRTVPGIRLKIIQDRWGTPRGRLSADDFRRLALPEGQAGEIVVSGDHVARGYLNGIGDEETKFRVGEELWHRTGDAGFLDDVGRLWLLGRCAAKVQDRHGTVYPFSVECAARSFSFVRRAAFLALSGRRCLAIELDGGRRLKAGDGDSLRRALSWARLDSVRAIKAIPLDRRHNAKVDYPALQELMS